jgi:hypothetical protein
MGSLACGESPNVGAFLDWVARLTTTTETKSKIKEGTEGTSVGDDASSKIETPKMSEERPIPTLESLVTGIHSLESQHRQLVSTFNALLHLDNITSPTMARAMSPALPLHVDFVAVRGPSRAGTARRTMSVGTISDDSVQWFDADDGPEEYVIEEPDAEAEGDKTSQQVTTEPESESEAEEGPGDTSTQEVEAEEAEKEKALEKPVVQRRTELPAIVTGDEMSLLAVLRKNVGKVCDKSSSYFIMLTWCPGFVSDRPPCWL